MGLFGGGEDPKMQVTDYYASAHYGLCHGEVDEFNGVWYGEKRVWEGSLSGPAILGVAKGELFGGNKVEGGLVGTFTFMPGGEDQAAPQPLLRALARNGAISSASASQAPAYRGVCSVFLSGGVGLLDGSQDVLTGNDYGGNSGGLFGSFASRLAGAKGSANIGSNTAYIKPFWFKVRRRPKQCPFNTAIEVPRGDGRTMVLANPAGIIYECMVNGDWGMGLSASQIDDDAFTEAADALAAEGFGLGLLWHRQESVEDFIGSVLAHIDAALSFDPFTGLFRIKLIRGGYDIDELPVFGPDNAKLETFDRTGWGETINEIVVKWTNPLTEKEETVSVHDTANISVQGGALISETREFPGIRNAELALRVATRELLTASSSMVRAELTINRTGWRLMPGDVIALRWPLYGFDRLAMRVTQVDYGAPGSSQIKVNLIEDIFSLPESSFVASPGTGWVNPAREPTPLIDAHVFSLPYFIALQRAGGDPAGINSDLDTDFVTMLATHDATQVSSYDMVEATTAPNGDPAWQVLTKGGIAPRGELDGAMPAAVTSTPTLVNLTRNDVTPGALLWIGPFTPDGEAAYIVDVDYQTFEVELRRGVLDTTPKDWDAGTEVWVYSEGLLAIGTTDREVGDTVTLRGLPRTSLGRLSVDDASNVSGTLDARMHRPYRAGNLRAFGELFPDPGTYPEYPVTVTWSHRNRLTETQTPVTWDANGISAETGVEYRVRVEAIREDGSVDGEVDEVTQSGTEYVLDDADIPSGLAGSPFIRVTVTARRDGLDSWQSPTIRFRGPLLPPEIITVEPISLIAPEIITIEAIED